MAHSFRGISVHHSRGEGMAPREVATVHMVGTRRQKMIKTETEEGMMFKYLSLVTTSSSQNISHHQCCQSKNKLGKYEPVERHFRFKL